MTVLVSLVLADLHLTSNPRDEYRFKALQTIRDIAQQQSVSEIIILGDLTEEKDNHNARLVNRIVEELFEFTKIGPVTVLRGNHDYVDIDHPFFSFIGKIDKLKWVGCPLVDANIRLFLPHTRNYKRDWDQIPFNKYRLIFTHNSFKGALSESGHQVEGIPLDVFEGYKGKILSGDIHRPQKVGANLYYVGSPYSIDFGDNFTPRVLIVNGTELESIDVRGQQKVLIELRAGTYPTPPAPYSYVKIRVHLGEGEQAKWPEIKETYRKWAEKHRTIPVLIQPMLSQRRASTQKQSHSKQQDDKTVLDHYGQRMSVDDRTLKVGHRLMERTP